MKRYQSETLWAAFDLYVREQEALLPDAAALAQVTLSPELDARMKKMLTRRRRGFYVLFGTVGRRVASFLIALLIATTTVTFSVKALREPVLNFFAKIFDTHTQVGFTDDASDEVVFVPRRPTYVPAGYAVEEETVGDRYCDITYAHANGRDILYYDQSRKGGHHQLDTEDGSYTDVTVNGWEGMVVSNKGTTTLLFADDAYTYWLSGTCTAEELLKIAESIR